MISVYNTMTKEKESFQPLHPPFVGIYVCGPTVYDDPHLGHAKSYVSFDVIIRFLRAEGYKVRYVQNITDVGHLLDDGEGEDRVLKKARIEKLEPVEIAQKYEIRFFRAMDRLNCVRPDISCRATGHVLEMVELIRRLIEKGFAYESDGDVYYDVSLFHDYGKLSRRKVEDMKEGTRKTKTIGKKHPADFALWKKADKTHVMQWPSPWGPGYPGWHLECSTMAMKYLGESIDIHGGGIDNQFPHHECEIAQSEGATGKTFAKYWLHNNMVIMGDQKMSKSLGNFITIEKLFEVYSPMTVRFFILQGHYRSPQVFSDEALLAAEKGLERLRRTIMAVKELAREETSVKTGDWDPFRKRFFEAMEDDFNTANSLSCLFDFLKEIQEKVIQSKDRKAAATVLPYLSETAESVLGLDFNEGVVQKGNQVESELIEYLVKLRKSFRESGDWEIADSIRDEMLRMGIILEDSKDGSAWRKK